MIIRNLFIGIVFGFLLHFLYSRRKLLQILRVIDFHHRIIGRRSQAAINAGRISEPGSVSKRRNDEIMMHGALRDTLQAVIIFKNLAKATVRYAR